MRRPNDIGQTDNIGLLSLSSREHNRELYLSQSVNITAGDLPPGKYRAKFLVRDLNSPKTAEFTVHFEIAA